MKHALVFAGTIKSTDRSNRGKALLAICGMNDERRRHFQHDFAVRMVQTADERGCTQIQNHEGTHVADDVRRL